MWIAIEKPIFAQSCRSAQSGHPTAPREVHLPLLPHGPSGVHRHLPRRTRLRRSAGPEENRSVPLTFHRCLLVVPRNGSIQAAEHPHFTLVAGTCPAKFLHARRTQTLLKQLIQQCARSDDMLAHSDERFSSISSF